MAKKEIKQKRKKDHRDPSDRRDLYSSALNTLLEIFVSHNETSVSDVMSNGLRPVAEAADIDRIIVFRIWSTGRSAAGEIYRWDNARGGTAPIDEELRVLPMTPMLKGWISAMSDNNSCIAIKRSDFTDSEAAFLAPRGVQSILITPVFTEREFWGVVTFHDNLNEREFDEDCVTLLRSAARMTANALIREERTIIAARAAETLKSREKMLYMLNSAAAMFLSQHKESFNDMMTAGLRLIANELKLDRIGVYRNFSMDDGLHTSQIYRWDRKSGGTTEATKELKDVLYSALVPGWEGILGCGGIINGPARLLPDSAVLKSFCCVSALVLPVFIGNTFWGFVLLEDRETERHFDDDSVEIMRSAAYLCANTIIMHEMISRQRDEGKRLEALVDTRTAELLKATEEAKSASSAKSRFIANMSHEMRTPMNVIVGLTDLMMEDENTPGETKVTLAKISSAGNILMGLINDVLDMSKIEAGRLELMPDTYDVASLLNDIVTLNMIRIESKPITFDLKVEENLPASLFGDDLRVKQILNNLLSNAFKYTNVGAITLSATCQRDGDDMWVTFCVTDTGIGIRESDIGKLFSDYNQVDVRLNRKIEGTGLGLSITKKFVELMDGEISVESEYGKGTTFLVRIRQGFASDVTIGKETAKNLRSLRYTEKKKRAIEKISRVDLSYANVLVVDDFPTNLDVAAGMLRKYKMRVDCVTSGREAIAIIAAGAPLYNAVFMDHMMPEMDGIEATCAIRAIDTEYARNVPIIALTANAVSGNEAMFLENGFNAFLSKPINVMNLDSTLHKWVRDKSKE